MWSCEVRSWRANLKTASWAPIYSTDKANFADTANCLESGVLTVGELSMKSDSKMKRIPALANLRMR